ncbi:hypothetical protein SCLCIDRAFT_1218053 [Scleroderma citrinum Foug A]|uniref:Uncharacterized protein n=1 Tax=Scleroderma citrinum Foug A TaxID=1036808 RepID=A0A0C2ZBP0_9AGAM|nr:hypothetical protein SCLCIDRAFT_1218053 [Scleroderma citrinum Foug A]
MTIQLLLQGKYSLDVSDLQRGDLLTYRESLLQGCNCHTATAQDDTCGFESVVHYLNICSRAS